jgi:hypothetical protein
MKKDNAYLKDILDAISDIEVFIANITEAEFYKAAPIESEKCIRPFASLVLSPENNWCGPELKNRLLKISREQNG